MPKSAYVITLTPEDAQTLMDGEWIEVEGGIRDNTVVTIIVNFSDDAVSHIK